MTTIGTNAWRWCAKCAKATNHYEHIHPDWIECSKCGLIRGRF